MGQAIDQDRDRTGNAELNHDVFRCKNPGIIISARGKCGADQTETLAAILILLIFSQLFFVPEIVAGEASNPYDQNLQGEAPAVKQKLGKVWSEYADLVGLYNPWGLDISGGFEYRDSYRYDSSYDSVSSYWQTGVGIDIIPSYVQPSIHFEWMPSLFLVTRLQFDGYYYFGKNGSLLSFSSGSDPFGDQELRARRGTEESGVGSRILFQPTLQLKIGDIVLRNQSDVAKYWFPGKGPFFYEQEYDTLLKDGDYLFANRTQVLKELGSGAGGRSNLLGPFYEIVHAEAADLTRQRVGLLFYSEQSNKKRSFEMSHFFAEIGYNLQDRNRGQEIFFLIGIGGSSLLN